MDEPLRVVACGDLHKGPRRVVEIVEVRKIVRQRALIVKTERPFWNAEIALDKIGDGSEIHNVVIDEPLRGIG